jgi:hypothetical protein
MKIYESKFCAAMAGDTKLVEPCLISKFTIESSAVGVEVIKRRI